MNKDARINVLVTVLMLIVLSVGISVAQVGVTTTVGNTVAGNEAEGASDSVIIEGDAITAGDTRGVGGNEGSVVVINPGRDGSGSEGTIVIDGVLTEYVDMQNHEYDLILPMYRDSHSEIYWTKPGEHRQYVYSRQVFVEEVIGSGDYAPYEEVTSFSGDENGMTLSWYDKEVRLEYFANGPAQTGVSDMLTRIETWDGSYYFDHSFNDGVELDEFGYVVSTTNVDCFMEGNLLKCDEQIIDLTEAVEEQGLQIAFDPASKSLSYTGDDLSYIDPVIYWDEGQKGGVRQEVSGSGTNYYPSGLTSIGTEEGNGDLIGRVGWILFPLIDSGTLDISKIEDFNVHIFSYDIDDNTYGAQGCNPGEVSLRLYELDDDGSVNFNPGNDDFLLAQAYSAMDDGSLYYSFTGMGEDGYGDYMWLTADLGENGLAQALELFGSNQRFGIGLTGSSSTPADYECNVDLGEGAYLEFIYTEPETVPPVTYIEAFDLAQGQSYTESSVSAGPILIDLVCEDFGNGCAEGSPVTYCVDTLGACIPDTEFTEAFEISAEGISHLRYFSTDFDGNVEVIQDFEIQINDENFEVGLLIDDEVVYPELETDFWKYKQDLLVAEISGQTEEHVKVPLTITTSEKNIAEHFSQRFIDGSGDELEYYQDDILFTPTITPYEGISRLYQFEETSGTEVLDAFGGESAENFGAGIGAEGAQGNAYAFDGSDYVSLYSNPLFGITEEDFSINFWVKTTDYSSPKTLLFFGNADSADKDHSYLQITLTTARQIRILSGDEKNGQYMDLIGSQGSIPQGEWSMISIVRKSDNWKIYIDETLHANLDYDIDYDLTNFLSQARIGDDYLADGYSAYKGELDEVGIWRRSLSIDEISSLDIAPITTNWQLIDIDYEVLIPSLEGGSFSTIEYQYGNSAQSSNSNPLLGIDGSSGLTHHYALNELNGPVIDSVGTVSGINTGADTNVASNFGTSYLFEGADRIQYNSNTELAFGTGSFSIGTWFKTTAHNSGAGFMISKGSGNGHHEYALYIHGGKVKGQVYSQTGSTCDASTLLTSSENFNDGNWHNSILVFDSQAQKLSLYIDGALIQEAGTATGQTCTNFPNAGGMHPATLGAFQSSGSPSFHSYYQGELDEVSFWGQSLSQEEVASVYENGVAFYDDFIGQVIPGPEQTFEKPIGSFTSSKLTEEINAYLEDCEADEYGNCQVPLNFIGDSEGTMTITRLFSYFNPRSYFMDSEGFSIGNYKVRVKAKNTETGEEGNWKNSKTFQVLT